MTTVVFKRKIKTGDNKDLEIEPGLSYYLVWAMSPTNDNFAYHNALRGYSNTKVVLVPTTTPMTKTTTEPPTTTPLPPTTGKITFDSDKGSLTWAHDENNNEVIFTMVAPAVGWIGMGISKENKGMKGLDIMIGFVKGQNVSVQDYSASTTKTPTKDQQQNFLMISGKQENGVTTIKFKRKLNTGDKHDIVIRINEAYYLVWAYNMNSDDTVNNFQKHTKRGYSKQVILVGMATMTSSTVAVLILAVLAAFVFQ